MHGGAGPCFEALPPPCHGAEHPPLAAASWMCAALCTPCRTSPDCSQLAAGRTAAGGAAAVGRGTSPPQRRSGLQRARRVRSAARLQLMRQLPCTAASADHFTALSGLPACLPERRRRRTRRCRRRRCLCTSCTLEPRRARVEQPAHAASRVPAADTLAQHSELPSAPLLAALLVGPSPRIVVFAATAAAAAAHPQWPPWGCGSPGPHSCTTAGRPCRQSS